MEHMQQTLYLKLSLKVATFKKITLEYIKRIKISLKFNIFYSYIKYNSKLYILIYMYIYFFYSISFFNQIRLNYLI